ncbi:hypothetical protein Bbelb_368050, partial [Branchiostoma belcheri]
TSTHRHLELVATSKVRREACSSDARRPQLATGHPVRKVPAIVNLACQYKTSSENLPGACRRPTKEAYARPTPEPDWDRPGLHPRRAPVQLGPKHNKSLDLATREKLDLEQVSTHHTYLGTSSDCNTGYDTEDDAGKHIRSGSRSFVTGCFGQVSRSWKTYNACGETISTFNWTSVAPIRGKLELFIISDISLFTKHDKIDCQVGRAAQPVNRESFRVIEHIGHGDQLCHNDYQCISGMGRGACCAPRNLIFAPVPECKSAGRRTQLCHVASNFLPYPLHKPHGFHRCPCGNGLACVPRRRGSIIGVCKDLRDL